MIPDTTSKPRYCTYCKILSPK